MLPFYERLEEYSKDQSISVRTMSEMGNHSYWHFHQKSKLSSPTAVRKCIVGDYLGHYQPNELVIAGSFLPHDFNYADDNDKTNMTLIHFNPKLVGGILEFAPIRALLDSARYGLSFRNIPPNLVCTDKSLEALEPARRVIGSSNCSPPRESRRSR